MIRRLRIRWYRRQAAMAYAETRLHGKAATVALIRSDWDAFDRFASSGAAAAMAYDRAVRGLRKLGEVA